MTMVKMIIIQLFIYPLGSTASNQYDTNSSSSETTQHNTTKSRQSGLLISKPEFLKIGLSVDLQTASAAGTRRAEGQWLQLQPNAVKLQACRLFVAQWGNI
jgi:hypothetical protein